MSYVKARHRICFRYLANLPVFVKPWQASAGMQTMRSRFV